MNVAVIMSKLSAYALRINGFVRHTSHVTVEVGDVVKTAHNAVHFWLINPATDDVIKKVSYVFTDRRRINE